MSRTTGRPAEVLREGSGIKVEGTAGDGLAISAYIRWRLNFCRKNWPAIRLLSSVLNAKRKRHLP